jgi:hypothetical protein
MYGLGPLPLLLPDPSDVLALIFNAEEPFAAGLLLDELPLDLCELLLLLALAALVLLLVLVEPLLR